VIFSDVRGKFFDKGLFCFKRKDSRFLVHTLVAEPVAVGAINIAAGSKFEQDICKNIFLIVGRIFLGHVVMPHH
jgi:hypothetical protein